MKSKKVKKVKEPEFKTALLIEHLQAIENKYPGSVLTNAASGIVSNINGIVSGHIFDFVVTGGHEYVFDETPPEVVEGYLQVTFRATGEKMNTTLYLKRQVTKIGIVW